MRKVKEGKREKTINTINVSFGNTEWEALQKAKGEQSWRKFILERAAIDSSNDVQTIEQIIRDKINALEADLRQPWCIILNEEAYLALCSIIQNISGTASLRLEQYRGLIVILDRTSVDAVKILQKPFDELTLSPIGAERD